MYVGIVVTDLGPLAVVGSLSGPSLKVDDFWWDSEQTWADLSRNWAGPKPAWAKAAGGYVSLRVGKCWDSGGITAEITIDESDLLIQRPWSDAAIDNIGEPKLDLREPV
jgi:hypothetical protein